MNEFRKGPNRQQILTYQFAPPQFSGRANKKNWSRASRYERGAAARGNIPSVHPKNKYY